MKPSKLDKKQALKVVKVAVYAGLSAFLDALISATTGTEFGIFTVPINVTLVFFKQLVTDSKA